MKVGQIFVISENLDWERGAVKVVSPSFESTDNHQEFMVVDIVVSFHWRKRLRKVRTGMPFAI